jgi:hypothetical protein
MDECGIAHRGEDAFQVIVNRLDETRRELPDWRAGVHQRRRIWKELQRPHRVLEPICPFANVSAVARLDSRHSAGHPAEHVIRRFEHTTACVLAEIASVQQFQGRSVEGGRGGNGLGHACFIERCKSHDRRGADLD